MFKKRASALLIAAALLPAGLAHALGLGEVRLSSALDQPLRAEIELRSVGDLSADEIRVRLASGTEFERAGVERLYSLTELRFAVDLRGDGSGVVRISTEQPVREPYLDFLVEVKWPNGRVLREYTLLLDLPTYKPAPPPVVQAPVSRAPARPPVSPRSDGGGAWSGGDRYQVVSGDTLWRIASRSRPSGTSVQDMMEAL
ncbi:MAG: FimV family protein, partial [Gammaproteobacteria bacterium]